MSKHLLPFPDYQRIYQVIYSVLQASEIAVTNRACFLFAVAGSKLLREHYGLAATISAGGAAFMVDEACSRMVVYGREQDGLFVGDSEAFHAWVQCDGWMIDFMAPIMDEALREDGHTWKVPRRMLQKRLDDGKMAVGDVQHQGEFCLSPTRELADELVDNISSGATDLIDVCNAWVRRPPKSLRPMQMGDSHGPEKTLTLRAPAIEGIW